MSHPDEEELASVDSGTGDSTSDMSTGVRLKITGSVFTTLRLALS